MNGILTIIQFISIESMSFLWFLGIPFGAIFILKTEWFVQNFGKVAWAEEHLGYEGGTRLFYKLLGVIIILISLFGFTGGIQGVILTIFAPMMPKS